MKIWVEQFAYRKWKTTKKIDWIHCCDCSFVSHSERMNEFFEISKRLTTTNREQRIVHDQTRQRTLSFSKYIFFISKLRASIPAITCSNMNFAAVHRCWPLYQHSQLNQQTAAISSAPSNSNNNNRTRRKKTEEKHTTMQSHRVSLGSVISAVEIVRTHCSLLSSTTYHIVASSNMLQWITHRQHFYVRLYVVWCCVWRTSFCV